MNRCGLFSLLAFGAIVAATAVVHADDTLSASSSSAPAQQAGARFMLRNTDSPQSIEKKPTASDFTWAALTANGPANGMDPIIGEKSGKSRYDFKDGLPHPYFITSGK